jgi:hypothetical protein
LYEYNDKRIVEARRYHGDDHALELKDVFTLDHLGRVSKVDLYTSPSNFEEIGGVFTFSYEASGQLKSRRFSTPNNAFQYRDEFTYDAAGNRIKAKKIRDPGQQTEYLNHEIVYTPGEKMIPKHWNDIVFLLSVTNLDDNIREMFTLSKHRKTWDSDGTNSGESQTEATERLFNTDGYLTKQVLTLKYLNSEVSDEIVEVMYEYTE